MSLQPVLAPVKLGVKPAPVPPKPAALDPTDSAILQKINDTITDENKLIQDYIQSKGFAAFVALVNRIPGKLGLGLSVAGVAADFKGAFTALPGDVKTFAADEAAGVPSTVIATDEAAIIADLGVVGAGSAAVAATVATAGFAVTGQEELDPVGLSLIEKSLKAASYAGEAAALAHSTRNAQQRTVLNPANPAYQTSHPSNTPVLVGNPIANLQRISTSDTAIPPTTPPPVKLGFTGDQVTLTSLAADATTTADAVVSPDRIEFTGIDDGTVISPTGSGTMISPTVAFTQNELTFLYPISAEGKTFNQPGATSYEIKTAASDPAITAVKLLGTNIAGLTTNDLGFAAHTINLAVSGLTLPTNTPAFAIFGVSFADGTTSSIGSPSTNHSV